MLSKIALSDQLEERLVEFAARIIDLPGRLSRTFQARHIANQILRSGTAGAPNYAEARSAESRQDFIHKMRIVGKELNETAVWLRIISKSELLPRINRRHFRPKTRNSHVLSRLPSKPPEPAERFPARMRIENWELSIDQILPILEYQTRYFTVTVTSCTVSSRPSLAIARRT